MEAKETIQPPNVAGATLLVQLILLAIVAVTVSLSRRNSYADDPAPLLRRTGGQLTSAVLLLSLISFAALIASEDFSRVWSPIFGGGGINAISTAAAVNVVFILDIVFVAVLISATGGSHSSPFTGALFTLPALAIFLRATPGAFLTYAVIATLAYLMLLPSPRCQLPRRPDAKGAAAFMNLSCLALSMFTGYITRPVPIDQLAPPAVVGEPAVRSAP